MSAYFYFGLLCFHHQSSIADVLKVLLSKINAEVFYFEILKSLSKFYEEISGLVWYNKFFHTNGVIKRYHFKTLSAKIVSQTNFSNWMMKRPLQRFVGFFSFVQPSSVGAYYFTPTAGATFLHNDLLCNDTFSLIGRGDNRRGLQKRSLWFQIDNILS